MHEADPRVEPLKAPIDGQDLPRRGQQAALTAAELSNDDDYPYDDEDGDGGYCYRCDNQGFILTCIDDLCRGAGECMHGDGETVCPDCHGDSAW